MTAGKRLLCGLLAALAGAVGLACAASDADRPPDVVLVVIDTARGDHFSLYGYGSETSPRLDAFAAGAITFERAYSTSCWTLPSHASLFTGLLPVTHGATQEHLRLDDSLETLASLLGARGYETAAFSNNSWVSEDTGLLRGFGLAMPMWKRESAPGETPHPTNREIFRWLEDRGAGSDRPPFLLFVNYIEPHWPYEAPRSYRDRFLPPDTPESLIQRSGFPAIQWYLRRGVAGARVLATRARMYDAELSYADAVLGELLDGLAAGGWLEHALVIVTSDHGENLGEHGHQGHSFALYEPTLHVPLVIRPPHAAGANGAAHAAGTRRSDPVQLTDVFATIARAAGATPSDPRVVGRDLLGGPLPEQRPLVAEYYRPDMFLRRFPDTPRAQAAVAPYRRRLRSIRIGDDKLVWGSDGLRELYDTRLDPAEQRDRSDREPERVRALTSRLDAVVRDLTREPEPIDVPLDPETEQNLRALGYL
jgi:arylsulfatase A-like enzyme